MTPSPARTIFARRHSLISVIALAVFAITLFACGDSDPTGQNGNVQLAITSPEADTFQNESRVLVEGTASGTNEVEVNGIAVDVEDGHWEVTLEFDDGDATATAITGGDSASVDFVVDTQPPTLFIESPDRGTVIEAEEGDSAPTVTVRGEVLEAGPSGLLLVQINGDVVTTDDGAFTAEVEIQTGFNLIEISAVDQAHNEMVQHRALIYGPLSNGDDPIEEAARLDISDPSGTTAIAEVIEAYLTPAQVHEFILAGFAEQDLPVDITDLHWEELELDVSPEDGYLDVELILTELRVDGEFQFTEDSELVNGFIEIAEATLTLHLELQADDDNQLHVDISHSDLELHDVVVDLGGEDGEWLGDIAEIVILYAFEQFVDELVSENLYDPALLTQEVEFLNRTIEIRLLLEDVLITPNGISASLGIEFPADKYTSVPDVPGALHRPPGGALGGSVDRPLTFHSTRTAADRTLHAIWRAGLFHQQIGGDELSDIQLPFDLDAGGLASLLDSQIRDIHESDTPAELRLRPMLAPVVEFRTENEDYDATVMIGDFLVDFILRPDANTETLVLTVALHLEIDLELIIEDGELDFDFDVRAQGDVAAEPEISFDHEDTVSLITDLIGLVPVLVGSDLDIAAEAELEWATIGNPVVEIHGAQRDLISAGVDLEAAQDFIEDDEVDADDD